MTKNERLDEIIILIHEVNNLQYIGQETRNALVSLLITKIVQTVKQACQRDEGPDPGAQDAQSPHTRQFLHFQPSLGMLEINGLSFKIKNCNCF